MHSLIATHTHYATLLRRVGRCLSFGCTHPQTLQAASLVSRLTRAWPSAFLAAEGYVPLGHSRTEIEGRDGVEGVIAAAEASNRRLLGALLGEGRFSAVRDDMKVYPVHDVKLPRTTTLTTLSRFGDSPQALPTLSQIPPSWSTGAKSLLLMQSAVLSASMRPVATVSELLRVESAGVDVRRWAGENEEALGDFLKEVEEVVREGEEEVRGLEGVVEGLEGETWDREGAVEDMGGKK